MLCIFYHLCMFLAYIVNISCIYRIQGNIHPSFILPLAFIHKRVHQWANLILGIYNMFEHINAIVSGQIYDRFVQGNIRPHFNFAHCQLANLRLGKFYFLSYLNITKFKDSTKHFACVKGRENNYAYSGKL